MARKVLSPHLQVYKFQLNSILSISNRMSGIFLYIFFILLSTSVFCNEFCNCNFIMRLINIYYINIIIVFTIFFHSVYGVKHIINDMGYCLNERFSNYLSWASLILSALLSLLFFSI